MKPIGRDQLIGQLKWRYATKQFDPQGKISADDWATLEDALVLTPSSYGLQPWKFVVVTDPVVRERLVSASHGQRQVADASHLVVFAIKKDLCERDIDSHLDRISEVRGVPREALGQFREMMVGNLVKRLGETERNAWASKQVYIALGNFLTSAALLGIDACPMEGVDPAMYDEILDLKKHRLSTVVAAPAGYRAATDKYSQAKKVRFARDHVLVRV
ncbi:MAG TPA: NAD(P)H-dependent oxidoreductase [Candidatus Sulfotelmatobacter sp.]|nr:NAD(P)H-dependent oxidoreductase [Candidatus Sulfotelmatobacter sp.]